MLIKHNSTNNNRKITLFEFSDLSEDELVLLKDENHQPMVTGVSGEGSETATFNEEELQRVKESCFQEGLEQGKKAGFENGVKSIQSHVESFIKLMNAIRKQQEELINESEQFIVDFVFKIMEKILGSEEIVTSKIAKDKLQSVVREALNKFSDSSKYTIRVHKEIAEIWDEYKNRVLSRLPENFEISLIEDPSLNPSDCLIESDKGILDARVESQLCELKNVFKNQTNNAHSEPV